MTSDDDDYGDKSSDSNCVDPLLKKPYLTNIRIKINTASGEIVGVTGDSLVASKSGRKLDSNKRQAKEVSKSNCSRSYFATVGVNQVASGNWVSDGKRYLLHCMLLFLYPNSVVFVFLVIASSDWLSW